MISKNAKNAIVLGILCSVAYFAVYIARNVLGAVTPDMLEGGMTLEYIGRISSVYLFAYAIGQLINGFIGDYLKAKYMVCLGLFLAGISGFAFVRFANAEGIATVVYGIMGFSLSMIYGPMVKAVSDSTSLKYATRCSVGYTFASFFGSPAAGLFATYMSWERTFDLSSAVLVIMAAVCFVCFVIFEKNGIVKYPKKSKTGGTARKDYRVLLKRHVVKFALISALTGVVRTSFVALLTTYFVEHLAYGKTEATSLFSTATLIISFTTFIAIFFYERVHENVHLSTLVFFSLAALCFGSLLFIKASVLNVVITVIAIMASNAAATMLWSVYCPSLCDTGLVSGITGALDFLSYCSAALASLLIPIVKARLGWRSIIAILFALMVIDVIISIPYFISKKHTQIKKGEEPA